MSDNSWMNNPALGGISAEKLQMLSSLAEQAQGKSQEELLPFLMALSGSGSGGLSFDPSETEAIINVMKNGKSPQEIRKIDKILSIMKKMKR
ncbi:MAG: hypothetical protein LUG99_13820 [Lachnospiraceae bacterium]|nr:hypothetical protein [Lachnospiraceae bacterium]